MSTEHGFSIFIKDELNDKEHEDKLKTVVLHEILHISEYHIGNVIHGIVWHIFVGIMNLIYDNHGIIWKILLKIY